MKLTRRNFLTAGGAAGCKASSNMSADGDFILSPNGRKLILPWTGLKSNVRVWVAGDTHFGMYDERDAQYADNYRRMSWQGKDYAETVRAHKAAFETMLANGTSEGLTLVIRSE